MKQSPAPGMALISFCNQASSPECALCLMDLANGGIRWITLSKLPPELRQGLGGVCGMITQGAKLIIVTQGSQPSLAIWDLSTQELVSVAALAYSKDPHSIVLNDGYIHIVSTGTNEIYRVALKDESLGEEELYWQYPDVRHDRDEVHLNGLTLENRRLIASCFGPRNGEGRWGCEGRVFYVDDGASIHEGLNQPHSPIINGSRLAFAESKTGRVYLYVQSDDGAWTLQREFDVGGYARGVAFAGQELLVGISADRKVSRSQHRYLGEIQENNPASLLCMDIYSGVARRVSRVDLWGRELYDVIPVGHVCETDPIEVVLGARLNGMESVIFDQAVGLQALQDEMQRLSLEYRNVLNQYHDFKNKYHDLRALHDKMLTVKWARLIQTFTKAFR